MSTAELQGDTLYLSGELDHASVMPLRDQAGRLLAKAGKQLTLDCSGVSRANSAGLALILALLRDAERLGVQLALNELPEDMRQMAHVCELTALLQPASTN